MVKTYRACRGVSFPKDEAAEKRMKHGKALAGDWVDATAGAPVVTTPAATKTLLADGLIEADEEEKSRG